jgi:uncharacterized protein
LHTPKLGNCPNCGKLFLRIRNLCDQCIQKQEEDYRKVADHLRQYPGCSIQELSEATGVSTAQIRQFIQSERIIAGHFPNLSYPCETCGVSIRSGKICDKCTKAVQELKLQVEYGSEHPNRDKNQRANGYISKYL